MAAENNNGKDFGKSFVEVYRARARQRQDDNVDIDMTDVLSTLMKEKYKSSSSKSSEFEKHEELTFQMKRPQYPYQYWMQDLPWTIRNKADPIQSASDHFVADNQTIMSIASTEAQFPMNQQGSMIQTKMESLLENVSLDLKTNYNAFKDSSLYYTGSMYEGLKVDAVDEFDFMIEMPVLSQVCDISVKSNKQMLRYELKDLSHFMDLPIEKVKLDAANMQEFFDRKEGLVSRGEKWVFPGDNRESWIIPVQFDLNDPNNWFNMAIIIRAFGLLIQKKLQQHLPEEWKLIPNESNLLTMDHFLRQKSAFTFDIIVAEENNQIVNIDVALCLPIHNLPLLVHASDPGDVLPEDFNERFKDNPSVHHAIIRNSNTLRISLSCKEKEAFSRFDLNDPRKLCMRFFKYLRNKFITHSKWQNDPASCLVNSYHIKTLFLYLFEIYPEQSSWSGANFGIRLKEAFLVLRSCFEKRILESFFIPYYNILRKYHNSKEEKTCNEADQVVCDIDELLVLFDEMGQLTKSEASELFYERMSQKEIKLIRILTDDDKKRRNYALLVSHIF